MVAAGLLARPAEAKLKVVATVNDLGAIAREVVGGEGSVTVLARSTQDPHFVDARPNLMLDLNRADAVVLVGAELEIGWLPVLLKGARNPNILLGQPGYIDASTMVGLKEVPQEKVDRSMGDIHPTGNPHLTTDPHNAVVLARQLAVRFGALDPASAPAFAANAETFAKEAATRITAWQQALAPFKGTPVVTYHRSWVYFTDFAGLEPVGTVEPKPGIPPNASHVAQLIGLMKAKHVPLLLQESWYGSSTSEIVAREAGARLVSVPGMTREGQRYLDHVDELVQAVVAALQAGKK
jgi:zinc/manganese transport system substrate-binding protein